MNFDDFFEAAGRVLSGDDSQAAAGDLERAIVNEHLEDERLTELLDALALYSPGCPAPFVGAEELRAVLRKTMRDLNPGGP